MKKVFVLPENLTTIQEYVVCAVIDSIPPDWAVLKGNLYAPKDMLDLGEALSSTKLVFGVSIHQMIVKTSNGQTCLLMKKKIAQLERKSCPVSLAYVK